MKNVARGRSELIVADLRTLTQEYGCTRLHTVDDLLSFRWTRKVDDCDEFELVVPGTAENLDIYREDRLIICNDFNLRRTNGTVIIREGDAIDVEGDILYAFTDMVGVIEKVDMKSPNKEDEPLTYTISGRSLESIFDRRIVWNHTDLVLYNNQEPWQDNTFYDNFISQVYHFLANEMIAPSADKVKKKKYTSDTFDKRAIWNIIMGEYHNGSQYSDPDVIAAVEKKALIAEDYMKKFFDEDTSYILELEGQTLLDVLKEIVKTFGLSLRAHLLINVPRTAGEPSWEGYEKMDMGKYGHIFYNRTTEAATPGDPRNLEIPQAVSWIFLELDVPTNRSYIENNLNDYVVFSQNVDNLQNIQFVKNFSNIKNITLVRGEVPEKGDPSYATIMNSISGEPTGLSRRELFTDAGDIKNEKPTNKKYNQKFYIPALEAAGRRSLFEHSRNNSKVLDGDAISGLERDMYVFNQDYYMGDLVQFVDSSYGESSRVQISEMTETIDSSGYAFSMSYSTPVIEFDNDDDLKYYYYVMDDINKVVTITGIKLTKVMEDNLTELPVEGKLWNGADPEAHVDDATGKIRVQFEPGGGYEEFDVEWKPYGGKYEDMEKYACNNYWLIEAPHYNGYDIKLDLSYSD